MALLGQLAALTTATCWSFTAVFFSFAGRQVGSGVVNRTRLVFALFFITLTHWLLEGSPFPLAIEPPRLGWLALSSILGLVLGDTFLFRAFVLLGPRLATLMMAAVPIISTFLGWLFLSETVSEIEFAGILMTVTGIAWAVTERRSESTDSESKQYKQGLVFGLMGAIGQASNLITAKFGLVGGYPTISATWIRILVAMIVLWLVAAGRREVGPTLSKWANRRAFPAILAGTFLGPFIGIWLSLVSVQLARVGIASTLMALPPVILIPVERIIYGTRISNRGAFGTTLAIAGVALIFIPF